MRKIMTTLVAAMLLVTVLCFSGCGILDAAKKVCYLDGELSTDYVKYTKIDGVTFGVPRDIKDNALSVMDLFGLAFSVIDEEPEMSELLGDKAMEVEDVNQYLLISTKFAMAVTTAKSDKKLDSVDSAEDMDALGLENVTIKKNSFAKYTDKDGIKIIVQIEMVEEDFGTYSGYLAAVENPFGEVMVMIVGSNSEEYGDDMLKTVAKSLALTGANFATPAPTEDSDEDEDIDWDEDEWNFSSDTDWDFNWDED